MIPIGGMALHESSGSQSYLALFFVVDACQTTTENCVATHSDFDKYQETSACCNQVDFAHALAVVVFDDAQAMNPQPGHRDKFSEASFDPGGDKHISLHGVAGDSISC